LVQTIEQLEYFEDSNESKTLVYTDELGEELLRFVSNNFFGWKGRYSLVKELMYAGDELKVRQVLKDNNLDPSLVDEFVALFEKQENEKRREEIKVADAAKEIEKEALDKVKKTNQNRKLENLIKVNKEEHNNDKKSRNPIAKASQTKVDRKRPQIKPNASRSGPSKLVSGFVRVRRANEASVREYFDDESLENKATGVAAEKLVFDLLKSRPTLEKVNHLGGNNKGYDIEYQKAGQSYFAEVKGLKASWDDVDVLLSRAQFEKAQKAGERYTLFIAEHVGSQGEERITEIVNPFEYFRKVQIDVGWRNFSEKNENLEPTPGRLVIIDGKKHKILDVESNNSLLLLVLENGQRKTFRPSKMQVLDAGANSDGL
jgi:hypothetical protein